MAGEYPGSVATLPLEKPLDQAIQFAGRAKHLLEVGQRVGGPASQHLLDDQFLIARIACAGSTIFCTILAI